MSKALSGLVWLVLACVFGLAWMVVFPWANQGMVGNMVWALCALLFFAALQVAVTRRIGLWLGAVSVISAVVAMQGPAQQWPAVVWMRSSLPNFLQFSLPQTESGLFFVCFISLVLLTLVLPLRRLLLPARARKRPFEF